MELFPIIEEAWVAAYEGFPAPRGLRANQTRGREASADISFELFNTIEGCIWVAMGVVCFILSRRVHRRYARISNVAGVVLVVFGFSDFCEVLFGSFLQPGMTWLFVWKIVGVTGLTSVILWYLLLRLRGSPPGQ